MDIKLLKPTLEMEEEYCDFVEEWNQTGQSIVPYSARPLGRDYRTWLEDAAKIEKRETCPADLVPAHTYFLGNKDGKILGAINIRHYLNDYLFNFGGHIGYGIRPSERNKGYATKMLALGLPQAKDLGISKMLITCNKSNISSAKVILKNRGVLENEVVEEGVIIQRYWVDLD